MATNRRGWGGGGGGMTLHCKLLSSVLSGFPKSSLANNNNDALEWINVYVIPDCSIRSIVTLGDPRELAKPLTPLTCLKSKRNVYEK